MKEARSNTEALFVNTLRDLAARAVSSDEYTILGASALIRKLLIDGSPLVDQVNRSYHLKLVFEISESHPSIPGVPEPNVWSVQDGLDPETSRPGKPRKTVNRDQLLATVLAIVDGKPYSLREIVLFEANVMGGVHAGSPNEQKEKVLQAVNTTLVIGGRSSDGPHTEPGVSTEEGCVAGRKIRHVLNRVSRPFYHPTVRLTHGPECSGRTGNQRLHGAARSARRVELLEGEVCL